MSMEFLNISKTGCATVVRPTSEAKGMLSYPIIETWAGTGMPRSLSASRAPKAMTSLVAEIAEKRFPLSIIRMAAGFVEKEVRVPWLGGYVLRYGFK